MELTCVDSLAEDETLEVVRGAEPWRSLGFSEAELAAFARAPANGELWAARGDDGRLLGFAHVRFGVLLGGYLALLAVAAHSRRSGVGAALMARFEQSSFARYRNAYLCVSESNQAARRFYAALGYQQVGELTGLLVADESELLLRKTLGPVRTR